MKIRRILGFLTAVCMTLTLSVMPARAADTAEFTVTTTPDTTYFEFYISAAGTFTIDWGDGTVDTINKTNTTNTTYSHTYSSAGAYNIGISGDATAYNTSNTVAAISFSSNKNVAGVSGSLGAIFGTLSNGTNPRFSSTFYDCSNLTGSIPADLFAGISGAPASDMFYYTFSGCRNLTGSIPAGLFVGISGAPAPYMFSGTFNGCSNLTGSIPADLFDGISGAPANWMFAFTFSGCSNLTGSIPADLFDGITGAPAERMFGFTFGGCSKLSGSIPAELFAGIKGAPAPYMFSYTFYDCSNLTGSIPADLFVGISGAPAPYMFSGTFNGCKNLSGSIPADLFAGIKGAPAEWMFSGTFSGCSKLSGEIPSELFAGIKGAPAELMFDYTFNGCKNLSGSIPAELFAGIKGAPAPYMFSYTFYDCSNLTGSIPADLFVGISGAPAPYMFSGTFSGCSKLSGEIPSELFAGIKGAPARDMFYQTFYGCSGLTGSIPADLFAGISGAPAEWMFSSTFSGCSGLTGSIPADLFAGISGAPASSMFSSTFYGCSNLTGYVDGNMFTVPAGDVSYPYSATFTNASKMDKVCPAGTYAVTKPDSSWSVAVCSPCPDSHPNFDKNASSINSCYTIMVCNAGEYYDTTTSQCTMCPAGSYCPGETKLYYDGTTDNTPIECDAGTYSGDGAAACTPCPNGMTSNAGASVCFMADITITYDCLNGITRTQTVTGGTDFVPLSLDFCGFPNIDKGTKLRGWYRNDGRSFCEYANGFDSLDMALLNSSWGIILQENNTYKTSDVTQIGTGTEFYYTPAVSGYTEIILDKNDVVQGATSDNNISKAETYFGCSLFDMSYVAFAYQMVYDCQDMCLSAGNDADYCTNEFCPQYQITNSVYDAFYGLNTKSDGTGEYAMDMRTGDARFNDDVCVYPECDTLYEVWGDPLENLPDIYIDFGDGVVTGLIDAPISGLWSYSGAAGVTQSDLIEIAGLNLQTMLFAPLASMLANGAESGVTIENSDKRFVGFSASKTEYIADCVYPACNTVYAVYWDADTPFPGADIDMNGGIFNMEGFLLETLPSYPPNYPGAYQMIGWDLWAEMFGDANPTDDLPMEFLFNIAKPGYKLVDFSTDPNVRGKTTCIYPMCNKIYAIWEPETVINPGIYVDFNGGDLNVDLSLLMGEEFAGMRTAQATQMVVLPDNAPQLAELSDEVLADIAESFATVNELLASAASGENGEQVTFTRGKDMFIGLNTKADGSGSTTCVYPECNKMYAVWLKGGLPPITIDANGGLFNYIYWAFPTFAGWEQNDPHLKDFVGKDLWSTLDWLFPNSDASDLPFLQRLQNEGNPSENGNGLHFVRPGYKFVRLSTTPDGTGGTECVYPACHTYYAIWERGTPEVKPVIVDYNGGTLSLKPNTVLDERFTERTLYALYLSVPYDMSDAGNLCVDFGDELKRLLGSANDAEYTIFETNGHELIGWSAEPNRPGVECIYPECDTIYAIYDNWNEMCPVMSNIVVGDTKIPLYNKKLSSPAIGLRYKKQICYANMAPDAKSDTINIKYKGKVYHAE